MIDFKQIDFAARTPLVQKYPHVEVNVFQTEEWINFLREYQNAKPILLEISSEGNRIGYLYGCIVTKFGLRVFGSPFRGWQTYFMGFNLVNKLQEKTILKELPKFVFSKLKCQFLEIIDPNISPENFNELSYHVEDLNYFGIDLRKSEEDLFSGMHHSGRNCIRKSIKNGVYIEEANDYQFVEDYYSQYLDVLSKHNILPPYSRETLKKMIELLLPTGNILLLRAKEPLGDCIATGIFLFSKKVAVFWGAASLREYQSLRPNEPLAWHGMKLLKSKGVEILHFGGKCEQYKEKLGCLKMPLYRLMMAKSPVIGIPIYFLTSFSNEKYKNWMLRHLSG